MKILMLVESLVRGGKERRLVELIRGLRGQSGMSVHLALFSHEVEYPEIHDLCDRIYILERKTRRDPAVFSRLYRLIRDIDPDIIHSWGSMPSVYALPSVIFQRRTFVNGMVVNAIPGFGWRHADFRRARLTFPLSDAIVGNSEAGLKAYGAPEKRSHCIYNGFDFQRVEHLVDPDEVRRTFCIPSGKVVGMTGSFDHRKDFHTFVSAAKRIAEGRTNVTFLAIGDGDRLAETRESVPPALRERILFPGLVTNIESLIQLFDVGVLATDVRFHGEGISNAILEYMALGKPVVATDGGGTPEIVKHNDTGFIVRPMNSEVMAARIGYLLDNPSTAERMGARGLALVKEKFSIETMTERFCDLYNLALKK